MSPLHSPFPYFSIHFLSLLQLLTYSVTADHYTTILYFIHLLYFQITYFHFMAFSFSYHLHRAWLLPNYSSGYYIVLAKHISYYRIYTLNPLLLSLPLGPCHPQLPVLQWTTPYNSCLEYIWLEIGKLPNNSCSPIYSLLHHLQLPQNLI